MTERVLRDILALTALPATWVGQDPAFVSRALCDGLASLTSSAVVVARTQIRGRESAFASWVADPHDAELAALVEALRSRASSLPPTEAFALETGFACYGSPIGVAGANGALIAASRSPDFPSMEERLLLGLAASQVGTSLRSQELTIELATTRRELAAREKQAALGQLVSGVAHEIRTPLTYVANNLALLKRRAERSGDREPLPQIDEALAGVDRIRALVAQLRWIGRDAPSVLARLDLDPVVRDAVRLFDATHPSAARVEIDLGARGRALLDPLLVQQAVLNLLENGFEAADGAGTLRVRTRTVGEESWIDVEDDGPGFPPDVKDRAFDPFFTTKPAGLGLGLAIVRRAAVAHGGNVDLGTHAGGGARVRVRIPLSPPARAGDGRSEALADAAGPGRG